MLPMLLSLRMAWEESEAVTDSVPVLSRKGAGKLWNHLRNCASRTWYLEASNMEPARTCSSMNTVTMWLFSVQARHNRPWSGSRLYNGMIHGPSLHTQAQAPPPVGPTFWPIGNPVVLIPLQCSLPAHPLQPEILDVLHRFQET